MLMDRTKLPYRKNCEGYFFLGNKVLAQNTGRGYILFPGGGIDEGESPEKAIFRESFEETGAIIKNLKKIGVIYFDWDENWAKTDKQKNRYNSFRGEEMHLFTGEIERFEKPSGDPEDEWKGELLADMKELIERIENMKPFPKNREEYSEIQLKALKDRLLKIEFGEGADELCEDGCYT
jgi:8-oxo-dGTP pyrophosphatase MutT (NUDIX family)